MHFFNRFFGREDVSDPRVQSKALDRHDAKFGAFSQKEGQTKQKRGVRKGKEKERKKKESNFSSTQKPFVRFKETL
jgi:hypothetical protein